jgi:ABC-type transport system involved in multi-copper enzyme maturation permease subunit
LTDRGEEIEKTALFFEGNLTVHTRLGPGPVFAYEWLTTTRRWQLYALRAGFVCAILAGMVFIFRADRSEIGAAQTASLQALASFGRNLYLTIVSIELTFVLLVAPAATAGAICLDKARGTLDHMLATDLSNSEIVLGKLGARLVPVLGLIACVLPIMALAGLLGGIDPIALAGSFLVAVGCAVLASSLALALSVWSRKSQDVLMCTYLMITLWLFSRFVLGTIWANAGFSSLAFFVPALWGWLEFLNPYYLVWAPYSTPGTARPTDCLEFLGICLGISGILVALATLRVRAVARAAGPRRHSRLGRRLLALCSPIPLSWRSRFGPSFDGNPVFWREWCRAKPTPLMRVVWAVYGVMGLAWIALTVESVASSGTNRDVVAMVNVFQVVVGLLLLSVDAATSLAEERARGSLDILLSTPLSTREILAGKWAGTFRAVPKLLFAPAITTLILAWDSGRWIAYLNFLGLILAYSAAIVSLGLALATWQSRMGRAVALCVGAYVVFAVGWPALIIPMTFGPRMNDDVVVPLIMGTPLYGTAFATMVAARGPHNMPGTPANVWMGCFLWIAIHGGVAAALYELTVATFDRCMGRMREWDRPVYPRYRATPASRQIDALLIEGQDAVAGSGLGSIPASR